MKDSTRVAHAIERLILARMEAAGIFVLCDERCIKALVELKNVLDNEPKKDKKGVSYE